LLDIVLLEIKTSFKISVRSDLLTRLVKQSKVISFNIGVKCYLNFSAKNCCGKNLKVTKNGSCSRKNWWLTNYCFSCKQQIKFVALKGVKKSKWKRLQEKASSRIAHSNKNKIGQHHCQECGMDFLPQH
jgi:hypothetical protein